jgi:hypothetical protein
VVETQGGLADCQLTLVGSAGARQVPKGVEHAAEVAQGDGHIGMLGTQRSLGDL